MGIGDEAYFDADGDNGRLCCGIHGGYCFLVVGLIGISNYHYHSCYCYDYLDLDLELVRQIRSVINETM